VTILVTSLYANSIGGQAMDAAHVLCTEIEQKIDGRHPSDSDYRFMTKFGARVANNPAPSLAVVEDEILMPYDD
jgi:hypothetical protein